jgi:cytochrome P450
VGTRNILVVSSPSAVEECLSNNDITFANRTSLTLAGKYLNYNNTTLGFSSYGELWRKLRRLTTTELFSTNRLAMLTKVREEEVKLLVKQIFEGCKGQLMSKVDLKTKTLELSFNIMLRAISGKRYYGEDAVALEGKEFQILLNEYIELLGSGNLNDFFPILKWIDFQGKKKKMVKLMKKMDCFLQKLLGEKRRNWSNDQRNMTLIDVMLDLQQKEPEFYTHEIVKGVILVRILIYRSIYNNFFCQQILFSNNLNFKITKSNDSYYSS